MATVGGLAGRLATGTPRIFENGAPVHASPVTPYPLPQLPRGYEGSGRTGRARLTTLRAKNRNDGGKTKRNRSNGARTAARSWNTGSHSAALRSPRADRPGTCFYGDFLFVFKRIITIEKKYVSNTTRIRTTDENVVRSDTGGSSTTGAKIRRPISS